MNDTLKKGSEKELTATFGRSLKEEMLQDARRAQRGLTNCTGRDVERPGAHREQT